MTVHSMTGFANNSSEAAGKRIDLELRSVNHRFLDVQFKMPDDLRFLEGQMRERIAAQVARGKLECRIQLSNAAQQNNQLHINQALADELAALGSQWCGKHAGLAPLGVADILKFPRRAHQQRARQRRAGTQRAAIIGANAGRLYRRACP